MKDIACVFATTDNSIPIDELIAYYKHLFRHHHVNFSFFHVGPHVQSISSQIVMHAESTSKTFDELYQSALTLLRKSITRNRGKQYDLCILMNAQYKYDLDVKTILSGCNDEERVGMFARDMNLVVGKYEALRKLWEVGSKKIPPNKRMSNGRLTKRQYPTWNKIMFLKKPSLPRILAVSKLPIRKDDAQITTKNQLKNLLNVLKEV